MPLINLLTQSSPSKSTDLNSAKLINMYMVGDQDEGKYQTAAFYTPGLTIWGTIASPVRAMFNLHGTVYAVGGNTFYSISNNGTPTTLGTLNTSTGFCKIRGNTAQLIIIDGSNGYSYTPSTSTFKNITSDTYVSSVLMTSAGNNYSISNVVFLSAVGSGATGTVVISNLQVIGVTVTNTGSAYTGNPPTVVFVTTSGSGGAATATLAGGTIASIAVTNAGTGYAAPNVYIVDTTGAGAKATCTVSAGGIASVTITNAGSGYTNPTIYFYDAGGTGAVGTANITGSPGSATISSVTITSGGSGYVTPSVKFVDTTGSGASGTVTIVNGVVTAVTVTAPGAGYTNPVCVISDLGGGGASGTAVMTTSSFPTTASDCVCQDEFGLVILNNSQQWQASNISDLNTWPALAIASTTGAQNNLVAITSLHRELWLFGETSTEVWYNAGNANFTFLRRPDVFIQYGCSAKQSVAVANNTVFWLGSSTTGGVVVLQGNGYSPVVVSTDPLNYQLSTYTTISDAYAITYLQEGHEFYVLTFPTQGVTWVLDLTTKQWHQRSSNGVQWLPNCNTFCYNLQLVGDPNSGNIYKLDMSNYTENGTAITKTLQSHPFYQSGAQVRCSRLQIDFDQTPGAQLNTVNLYISRDGGNTFGSAKPATPVQNQNGQWRVYWTRLGEARTWVFKITTNMNNKCIILGAWANFDIGTT